MLTGSLALDYVLRKSVYATRLVVFVAINKGINVFSVVHSLLTLCEVGKLAWGHVLDKLQISSNLLLHSYSLIGLCAHNVERREVSSYVERLKVLLIYEIALDRLNYIL